MDERRLTFWEATSVMVGAGVGAGIMAVPYLAEQTGFSTLLVILLVGYGANCLVHLMLAEVLFRTGRHLQIVELMGLYVFRGRVGPWLLWIVFTLLTVSFIANLAAYVYGEAEIVADLTGLAPTAAQLGVYAVSAGVVFFGLKAVGVSERFGALALVGCVVAIAVGALGVPFQLDATPRGGWRETLALYGMVMYAYYTFFSVPQVVKGLAPDQRSAVRAIVAGLAVNGALMVVIALVALGLPGSVTELAITGIAEGVGDWAGVIGSLFILAAFVTSYWAVSLALADILRERTGMHRNMAWLLATLPSLLLVLAGIGSFLPWLRLAAGSVGIVIALITIPMYVNARRSGAATPDWSLGRWGSPVMLALALLAMVLMAVGSLLEM